MVKKSSQKDLSLHEMKGCPMIDASIFTNLKLPSGNDAPCSLTWPSGGSLIYLLKMVIFHSDVSLSEGNSIKSPLNPLKSPLNPLKSPLNQHKIPLNHY